MSFVDSADGQNPVSCKNVCEKRHVRFHDETVCCSFQKYDDENDGNVDDDDADYDTSDDEHQPQHQNQLYSPDVDDELPHGDDETHLLLRVRRILQPIVRSKCFGIASVALTIVSTLIIGIEAEMRSDHWFFYLADLCMSLTFFLEWGLRCIVGGKEWFCDPMNILFTVIAWFPFVFWYWRDKLKLLQMLMRWLRISKIVYIIRDFRCMRTTWWLLAGLFGSTMTLIWSCLLVALAVFSFSILSLELIGGSSLWEDAPEDSAAQDFKRFHTAMFAMSRFLRADGAMNILEELSQRQTGIWLFFFMFQAMAMYVLMNLVTAVIVDRSLHIGKGDIDIDVQEEMEASRRQCNELFKLLDGRSRGQISEREFEAAFSDEKGKKKKRKEGKEEWQELFAAKCKKKLDILGIEDKEEWQELFAALDHDKTKKLSMNQFANDLPKLMGSAKAYELLEAGKTGERWRRRLSRLKDLWTSPIAKSNRVKEIALMGAQIRKLKSSACYHLTRVEEQAQRASTAAQQLSDILAMQ